MRATTLGFSPASIKATALRRLLSNSAALPSGLIPYYTRPPGLLCPPVSFPMPSSVTRQNLPSPLEPVPLDRKKCCPRRGSSLVPFPLLLPCAYLGPWRERTHGS